MSSAAGTGAAGVTSTIDRIAHSNRWRSRSLVEKCVLAFGLLVVSLAFPPWPTAVAVFVVASAAAVGAAGVPLRTWGLALAAPMGFVLTGAATLLVTVGTDGVGIAPNGLGEAAALTLRAGAASAALLLLATTTPATDLVAGMARLKVPAEIVELALLIYRFLFVLSDTLAAMQTAQEARLGHVGWRRRIRSSGLIAAALLPRAIDRAHRMEAGLAARGWSGGALKVLSPRRPVSAAGLGGVAAVLAALVVLGVATR
jgi:cobalt/nickel transport system permease protein